MSEARIHDQGYRRYVGDRLGVSSAFIGLIAHAAQRVLGLHRPARSKILPTIILVVSFAPAVVFIGLAALLADTDVADEVLPGYGDYYAFILLAVLLFVAFVAPEVLCTDRQSGMLSLYLASPLTRDTYLLAKAVAVLAILLSVTVAPELLLLVAYSLEGAGPGGVVDFLELLGRILAGGTLAAVLPAAVSLGIASLTPRRAFASGGIVVTLLASSVVANVLGDPEAADFGKGFGVLDLFGLPFELAIRLLGDEGDEGPLSQLSTPIVLAANLGWTVAFGALARFQYQRLSVDR